MTYRIRLVLTLLPLLGASVRADGQTLSVNGAVAPTPATLSAASNVELAVANGPGNRHDWVALYPVEAPDGPYLWWSYLNGLDTAPATGQTSATITTYAPIPPGLYEWRFYENNSWTRLATSGVVTITPSTAMLTVNGVTAPDAASASAATRISVGIAGGPARPGDWVGLFPAGAANNAYLDLRYLNNSISLPTVGYADAVLNFQAPIVGGNYELRFFVANQLPALKTSPLVVAGPTAALAVNGVAAPAAATIAPGSAVVVEVTGGPANAGDSVRLYPSGGSQPGSYVDIRYLNDSMTAPQVGVEAATLHFTAPATPGNYEFRLIPALGGLWPPGTLATSGTVTVATPTTTLTVNGMAAPTSATAVAGTRMTVSIADGPAQPGDWVGLFPAAAANNAYLDVRYLNNSISLPTAGHSHASVTFQAPVLAGNYEVRFFAANVFPALRTSNLVVSASTAALNVNGAAAPAVATSAPGMPVTVVVSGGPANPGDSVRLFSANETNPGAYLDIRYFNNSMTAPQVGLDSATLHFSAPATPGTYEFRLITEPSGLSVPAGGWVATSGTLHVAHTTQVEAPMIAPAPGAFTVPQLVTMSTTTTDAVIRYTLDGSDPSAASALYVEPFIVDATVTVKARAFRTNWVDSTIAGALIAINPGPLPSPVASPVGGWIQATQSVTLSAGPGTEIRYTLDGSGPTSTSPVYTGPLTIPADNTTLRASAFRANWATSSPSSDVYRFDNIAPTISGRHFPTALDGWHVTAVTVRFHCADNGEVASCTSPITVASEGIGQTVTGTAIDTAGRQSTVTETVNLDLTPPVLAMASPADESTTTSDTVVVTGAVSEALSGLGSVLCNGVETAVVDGQVSCTVAVRPGRNTIALSARDVAGNSASAAVTVTRIGTEPSDLTLTPQTRRLVVDEQSTMTLRDDFGVAISGAEWSSTDPTVVSLSTDDPPVLTAMAPGTAVILAIKDGTFAMGWVHVLGPEDVSDGYTKWEFQLPFIPNLAARAPIYTHPIDASGPDAFTVAMDLTSDEYTVWPVTLATGQAHARTLAPGKPLFGDAFGGLVAGIPRPNSNCARAFVDFEECYTALVRFAGPASTVAWRYESRTALFRPAQGPDGTIYAIEEAHQSSLSKQVVMLDGATGVVTARVPLEYSVLEPPQVPCTINNGVSPSFIMGPIVAEDGSAYVLNSYETGTRHCPDGQWGDLAVTAIPALKLIRLSRDGMVGAPQELDTRSGGSILRPLQLLPDGLGGLLVVSSTSHFNEVNISLSLMRIDREGVRTDVPIPLNSRIEQVGQAGTAYMARLLSGSSFQRSAIDLQTGQIKWVLPAGFTWLTASPDGGAMVQNASKELVRFDGNGQMVELATPPLHEPMHVRDAWIGAGFGLTAFVGNYSDATRWDGRVSPGAGGFGGPIRFASGHGNSQTRRPGIGIHVKGHPIGLPIYFHMSVRVVPARQDYWTDRLGVLMENSDFFGNKFFTLGAGPSGTSDIGACSGLLTSDRNRPADVGNLQWFLERLQYGPALEDQLIESLLLADAIYQDRLPYACFPESNPGYYNSNSFAIGLIRAVGLGEPRFSHWFPSRFPGSRTPVPPVNFGQ